MKHASESLAVPSGSAESPVIVDSEDNSGVNMSRYKAKSRKPYCVDCDNRTKSEIVKPDVVLLESRLSIQKKMCAVKDKEGNCPGLCSVLQKIDRKCEEVSVKKMKLSLKYRKKKQ